MIISSRCSAHLIAKQFILSIDTIRPVLASLLPKTAGCNPRTPTPVIESLLIAVLQGLIRLIPSVYTPMTFIKLLPLLNNLRDIHHCQCFDPSAETLL